MENNSKNTLPGVGLSARPDHYQNLLNKEGEVPWLEILIDNYFNDGSLPQYYLDKLSEIYPLAFHSTLLSLGSIDAINWDYLRKLKKLIKRYTPALLSDHLSFSSVDGNYLHDLIPLPYTEEVVDHVAFRIKQIQDFLDVPFAFENVSGYMTYESSEMLEGEFINEVAERADCKVLLDVNNAYVNQENHGTSALDLFYSIARDRVAQIHLAGFTKTATGLLDTHDQAVDKEVWQLYKFALNRFGHCPTCIEWDDQIPSYNVILKELLKAKEVFEGVGYASSSGDSAQLCEGDARPGFTGPTQ